MIPGDLEVQHQGNSHDVAKKNEDILQPMIRTADFDILNHASRFLGLNVALVQGGVCGFSVFGWPILGMVEPWVYRRS